MYHELRKENQYTLDYVVAFGGNIALYKSCERLFKISANFVLRVRTGPFLAVVIHQEQLEVVMDIPH